MKYYNQIDMSFEFELDEKINIDDYIKIHDEKPLIIDKFGVRSFDKKYDVIDRIMYDKNRAITLTIDHFINLISQSKVNELQIILEQDKNDMNYIRLRDKEGDTMLHFAVFSNNHQIAKILLLYGIDPNVCDKDGQTALFRSVFCRDGTFVDMLVADHHVDVNQRDNAGNTTLHIAVLIKNHAVIIALMNNGADPNIMNNAKFRPADYAFVKRDGKLVPDQTILAMLGYKK